MTDKDIANRYRSFFGGDFMPQIRMDQTQGAPERNAYATNMPPFISARSTTSSSG